MIDVQLTANLQKYYPKARFQTQAKDVLDLLRQMDAVEPRFSHYILEDDGKVRKHVNIFIDGELLPKSDTRRPLQPTCKVHIMQALSGG